jgi:hypothetical protein
VAHDPYAALRVRNYRWFIVSLLAMTISSQIQAVVVAWQIYDITHDPLSLGLMGLAEALPFIGLALYAGHVADRANRRTISLIAITLFLACSLALLAFNLIPGFLHAPRRVAVLRRDLHQRYRAELCAAGAPRRSALSSSSVRCTRMRWHGGARPGSSPRSWVQRSAD